MSDVAKRSELEAAVSEDELNALKTLWRDKFAPGVTSRAVLAGGFRWFVESVYGVSPSADPAYWTRDQLEKCRNAIIATRDTI